MDGPDHGAMHGTRLAPLALALALVAVACGNPADAGVTSGPAATAAPGGGLTASWATATLVDVRTGERFRIADLVAAGTTVFVEPMAVWCSKCRAQQERAVEAFRSVDRESTVWIGLDVETAENADQLAGYADARGFDMTYVISDPETSRALVDDFGEVILNPPATNVIVLTRDGAVRHVTGGLSVEEIVDAAGPAGG